jgi:multiple sugar transport system substrate-binding protein
VLDRLREQGIEIETVVHADHPTLNRTVADLLGRGERIDLLATHSKYAPSQARWLVPLDDLVDGSAVAALAPEAVELCRFGGTTYCLPRLIDVRVLWARTDRVVSVPDTWDDLVASDVRFGFPGRSGAVRRSSNSSSLTVAACSTTTTGPSCSGDIALHAAATLATLAGRVGADRTHWHYDEVDAALLDGRVDMAAAWPGGWGAIAASPLPLAPFPYPAGPSRRVSYAGCHAWAIPTTCAEPDAAVAALHLLLGTDAQALDASGGNMCAHVALHRSPRSTLRRLPPRHHPPHDRRGDDHLPTARPVPRDRGRAGARRTSCCWASSLPPTPSPPCSTPPSRSWPSTADRFPDSAIRAFLADTVSTSWAQCRRGADSVAARFSGDADRQQHINYAAAAISTVGAVAGLASAVLPRGPRDTAARIAIVSGLIGLIGTIAWLLAARSDHQAATRHAAP